MCDAVGALYAAGRMPIILRYALHGHPVRSRGSSLADARRFMTARGWREATNGDYGMTRYPDQSFEVQRIELDPERPEAWVFSTDVGSLHNPLLWVLASTPDGTKADHLLLQLGFEASGPFETTFLRFRGLPYAVTRSESELGAFVDVFPLGGTAKACQFSPPGWHG